MNKFIIINTGNTNRKKENNTDYSDGHNSTIGILQSRKTMELHSRCSFWYNVGCKEAPPMGHTVKSKGL